MSDGKNQSTLLEVKTLNGQRKIILLVSFLFLIVPEKNLQEKGYKPIAFIGILIDTKMSRKLERITDTRMKNFRRGIKKGG